MRKPRNAESAPLRPLTPNITGEGYLAAPPLTRSQVQALYNEIRKLKNELASERKRHIRLESALSKYQGVLEEQLRVQQAAQQELRKALVLNTGAGLIGCTR